MQAFRNWTPPTGTLGRILDETRKRLPSLEESANTAAAVVRPGDQPAVRPRLAQALLGQTVGVIAEIKRRSPSRGSLNESIDPAEQAGAFQRGGAAAISVLTEPTHFGGSPDDMATVRRAVSLPILRKDFHISGAQLVHARRENASAVLLIARALSPDALPMMVDRAEFFGLESVVEVRTEEELERALDAGATIVGVNSRDLETLEVDPTVPERLIPKVPGGVIAIWESGVESTHDVQRAADCGADAVLVGSAVSRSADPESLVRSLNFVPRNPRRG